MAIFFVNANAKSNVHFMKGESPPFSYTANFVNLFGLFPHKYCCVKLVVAVMAYLNLDPPLIMVNTHNSSYSFMGK